MPVQAICPNPRCGASLSLNPDQFGRRIFCAKCGTRFEAIDAISVVDHLETSIDTGGSSARSSIDLPSDFGRYRIIRKIGQGGMGAVYLAHDTTLDRPVALKVPNFHLGSSPEVIERFRREARAAAGFHHPNFCPIYDVGQIDGTHYLSMAYIEGETLSTKVDRARPMPALEAARIVRQLATALAEAHRKNIIHRDLKPANVMIDRRGTLIIMDFGLARRVGTAESDLTKTGAMLGTTSYMSPEQVRGTKQDLGPATDIYALGVILYELAAGRRPFEGPATTVIGAILHLNPQPPSIHRPGLDPRLEAVCLKAMSKKAENRYPSMIALAEALAFAPMATSPVPPVNAPSVWRPLLIVVAAAVPLMLAMLGMIFYMATDRGTVRIGGVTAEMEVRIDGQEIPMARLNEPIVIRSGDHKLLVTRADVVLKTPKSFEVRRGLETIVFLEPPPAPPQIPPIPVPPPDPVPEKVVEEVKVVADPPPIPSEPPQSITDNTKVEPPPTDPGTARSFYDSAMKKRAENNREAAILDFDRAIELDPKMSGAYLFRALSRDKSDLDKTLSDLDAAVRLDPTDDYAYHFRAGYWENLGKFDKAVDDYEAALRLNPSNQYPCINLAGLLATCPDPKYRNGRRAFILAEKACNLVQSKDAHYIATLAAAHAELGEYPLAVRRLTEAMAMLEKQEDKDYYQEILELYQQKKPYRRPEP